MSVEPFVCEHGVEGARVLAGDCPECAEWADGWLRDHGVQKVLYERVGGDGDDETGRFIFFLSDGPLKVTEKEIVDAYMQFWRPGEDLEDLARTLPEQGNRLYRAQDVARLIGQLESATTALLMIRGNDQGESWSAGVAMSALASIEERRDALGECAWHPGQQFTLAVKLCDDDGIVRTGMFHHGTDYPCTGGAHWAGEHILCTSPAHPTHTQVDGPLGHLEAE